MITNILLIIIAFFLLLANLFTTVTPTVDTSEYALDKAKKTERIARAIFFILAVLLVFIFKN